MLYVTLIIRGNYLLCFFFCFVVPACKSLVENEAFLQGDLVKDASRKHNSATAVNAVHMLLLGTRHRVRPIVDPVIHLKSF